MPNRFNFEPKKTKIEFFCMFKPNDVSFLPAGDKLLGYVAKQTGWKVKYNAVLNLTFPESGANTKKLNYVFVKVIQVNGIFLEKMLVS